MTCLDRPRRVKRVDTKLFITPSYCIQSAEYGHRISGHDSGHYHVHKNLRIFFRKVASGRDLTRALFHFSAELQAIQGVQA